MKQLGRETKNRIFVSRAQDYLFTAFVARVAKILTYALGENYSGSTQVLSLRIGESPPSYVTLCGASSPNDLIRNLRPAMAFPFANGTPSRTQPCVLFERVQCDDVKRVLEGFSAQEFVKHDLCFQKINCERCIFLL